MLSKQEAQACRHNYVGYLRKAYEAEKVGMEYDLNLIAMHLEDAFPEVPLKFKVESGYDGDGLRVVISLYVHEPYETGHHMEQKLYNEMYNIENDLVFNSWSISVNYKEN